MLYDIQVNERGAENYLLTGFSAPFKEADEFVSLTSEWASAVGAVILKDRKNSLVTGNLTSIMNHLITWSDLSILNTEDFEQYGWDKLFDEFCDRHAVFIHADPRILLDMKRVEFEWGVAAMPGMDLSYKTSNGTIVDWKGVQSGTLAGSFIGVNRYSSNLAAAVKYVNWATSEAYQKELISNFAFEKSYVCPSKLSLLQGMLDTSLYMTNFFKLRRGCM